jgi:CheY-like chemotaxis protein
LNKITKEEARRDNMPKILVVEDDLTIGRLYVESLEGKVEVLWAQTVPEAFGLFKSHKDGIDLIVMDGMIGQEKGDEAIKIIREKGGFKGAILAASAHPERTKNMLVAGANEAVDKDKVAERVLEILGIAN